MNEMMYDDAAQNEGSSFYNNEEEDFLRLVIDVDDVLDNFEHRVLRGQIKRINKKTGEEYWDNMPDGEKIMNEIGVREIMSRVIGRVTKVARLSYKEDEEIFKDMMYFDFSLSELIAKRSDAWEMNMETAKSIKDSAIELVWDVLAGSRNGFTAINLKSTYSRSDVSRTDSAVQTSNKKTFLGIPIPGRR